MKRAVRAIVTAGVLTIREASIVANNMEEARLFAYNLALSEETKGLADKFSNDCVNQYGEVRYHILLAVWNKEDADQFTPADAVFHKYITTYRNGEIKAVQDWWMDEDHMRFNERQ